MLIDSCLVFEGGTVVAKSVRNGFTLIELMCAA